MKTSNGQVEIVRDGNRLAAAPGAQVRSADVVRTGAASSVGIIMNDNTLLSAGANSVLQLDKFSFDHKTQQGEMAASLRKGSLSVISGAIAKNNPGAVQFSTKNMMLKVLGTEFVIEAEGDGEE